MLARGAEINAKTNDGFTALIHAAKRGHAEVVKALLAHGADVNAKGMKGETVLTGAKKNGHKEIVRMLQEAWEKE